MERINILKQNKTVTDGTISALNNLVLPYEVSELQSKEDICSILIRKMNEYVMTSLNYGPVKLSCIQEEFFIKVKLSQAADRCAGLGPRRNKLYRECY